MTFDEMERNIPCKDGAYVKLDTNGMILFEILKELQKLRKIAEGERKWRIFTEGGFGDKGEER